MDFEEISVPVPWIEMAHDLGQVRYGSSLRRVFLQHRACPCKAVSIIIRPNSLVWVCLFLARCSRPYSDAYGVAT